MAQPSSTTFWNIVLFDTFPSRGGKRKKRLKKLSLRVTRYYHRHPEFASELKRARYLRIRHTTDHEKVRGPEEPETPLQKHEVREEEASGTGSEVSGIQIPDTPPWSHEVRSEAGSGAGPEVSGTEVPDTPPLWSHEASEAGSGAGQEVPGTETRDASPLRRHEQLSKEGGYDDLAGADVLNISFEDDPSEDVYEPTEPETYSDDSLENAPDSAKINETVLVISLEEWKDLLVPSGHKLRQGWTDVMTKKLRSVISPSCTWTFTHSTVTPWTRKRKNGHYMRAYARCKREDCQVRLKILVREMPTSDAKDVNMIVVLHGEQEHQGLPAQRQLRGNARKLAAKATISIGGYNVRKDFLNSASEEALRDGDFDGVPSLEVLRQAAAQERKHGRFDEDVHRDLLISRCWRQGLWIFARRS